MYQLAIRTGSQEHLIARKKCLRNTNLKYSICLSELLSAPPQTAVISPRKLLHKANTSDTDDTGSYDSDADDY